MRKEFDVEAYKLALDQEAGCAAPISIFVVGFVCGHRYLHCHVCWIGTHVRYSFYVSRQFYV